MKLLMFLMMFLLLGAFFIVSENNLALKNSEAREKLVDLYLDWAGRLYDNSRDLTGYVAKMEWLPEKGK